MAKKDDRKRLVIRPLSGIIYFYPSIIAAIVCGVMVSQSDVTAAAPGATGIVFMFLFLFNVTVVAFDYTRLSSIVIVLIVVILVLLSAMYPEVREFFNNVAAQPLFMNATFYWFYAAGMGLIVLAVFFKSLFNYWEIKNNELIHHHGFLGDTERWPAPGMRVSKEIKDVMEYILARSGRLVLIPQSENRAIVLDNIMRIRHVEERMQKLLNTLLVDHTDE